MLAPSLAAYAPDAYSIYATELLGSFMFVFLEVCQTVALFTHKLKPTQF